MSFRARVAAGVVLILAAAGGPAAVAAADPAGGPPRSPVLIVPASSVPGIIAARHPVILSVQSAKETGASGFLRGAVAVDEDAWTADSSSEADLGNLGQWGRLIGGLGISGRVPVLVYDDGELKFASRIRFLLARSGVRQALLVNGGWPALQRLAARGKLATQPSPSVPRPRRFAAHVTSRPIPVVFRRDVAADLHHRGVILLDVRSPAEYRGAKLIPPVTRGGHIPGAVSLPETLLFTAGTPGTLMGRPGLARLFTAHGLTSRDRIVVYCQDGARSSLVAAALSQSGYPSVSLYYLSYVNWQADPRLPVQK